MIPELDEPIAVVPYNPDWPLWFAEERDRILAACSEHVEKIEHIGSTSVPGLAGKPVIDLAIGIVGENRRGTVSTLERLGYEDISRSLETVGFRGRTVLRYRQAREFNAHVMTTEDDQWAHFIRFRNYLRCHPDIANAYGRTKLNAARSAMQLIAYSIIKHPVVADIERDMVLWNPALQSLPEANAE